MSDRKLYVLLVEDNPNDVILFKEHVCEDIKVIDVPSLEDAIKLLDQAIFSLVLVDLNLKDSNGIDTIMRVTETSDKFNIPSIVLTSSDNVAIATECIKSGAQDYLCKDNLPDKETLKKSFDYAVERYNHLTKHTTKIAIENDDLASYTYNDANNKHYDGAIQIDSNHMITFADSIAYNILKQKNGNLIGTNFTSLFAYPADMDMFLYNLTQPHSLTDNEFQLINQYNEVIQVRLFCRACIGKHDAINSYIITLTDASVYNTIQVARQDLEKKLKRAQELESLCKATTNIVHEINTPVQDIINNLNFLEKCFGNVRRLLHYFQETPHKVLPPDNKRKLAQELEEFDVYALIEKIPTALSQSLDDINQISTIIKHIKPTSEHSNQSDAITMN